MSVSLCVAGLQPTSKVLESWGLEGDMVVTGIEKGRVLLLVALNPKPCERGLVGG